MTVLHVVDAFTHQPYAGNPAAVALLDSPAPEWWMQAVAREMNLAETAFAVGRPDGDFDLRWFTPTTEVDLCGHATLASAHVVGRHVRFHTRSGVLSCHHEGRRISMDFPADPTEAAPPPPALTGVLSCARGRSDLLVELATAGDVRSFVPDLAMIAALDRRAMIVTAPGDRPGVDFVSRVFCPAVGIPEDPVTGSAHCTLAGFWGPRLGRDSMVGYQASARGGTVEVTVAGDRVLLTGEAVTVSEVRLLVEPAAPVQV